MDGPELPGASRGALRNKAWLAMVSSMLPHRDNGRSPADSPDLRAASRGALKKRVALGLMSCQLLCRDNGRSPADGTELLQPPGSTREGPEAASIGEAEDFGLDRKKDSRSA